MNDERPVIKSIQVYGPVGEYGEYEAYQLGGEIGVPDEGKAPLYVKEIARVEMPGNGAMIPYVQVWSNLGLYAEFCQHQIVGVYFVAPGEKIGGYVVPRIPGE